MDCQAMPEGILEQIAKYHCEDHTCAECLFDRGGILPCLSELAQQELLARKRKQLDELTAEFHKLVEENTRLREALGEI